MNASRWMVQMPPVNSSVHITSLKSRYKLSGKPLPCTLRRASLKYMRPEVALLYSGVGLDVLGKGFDQFPSDLREQILAKYPRKYFKKDFIQAYFAGFAHKPGTTYGTVNAGVCERYIPGYRTPNACDLMAASPFPDSE